MVRLLTALFCMLWLPAAMAAPVTVNDDTGVPITLAAPPQRIVSLAPHATEMLFLIGAGPRLVGAVEFSDYPEAAKQVPRVGGYTTVDLEKVRALSPDLVVAWTSGNSGSVIEKLRKLGIPVFVSEAHLMPDIATDLEKLGRLTGQTAEADAAARNFRQRYERLHATYAQRRPVRTFYQIWEKPLMTINGKQIISDAMRACGAVNVFADLPALAPTVEIEAVLAANPELIASSGHKGERIVWLDAWRKWPRLQAVQKDNLALLPPDLLNRLGPRIIDGAEKLCEAVDAARNKR